MRNRLTTMCCLPCQCEKMIQIYDSMISMVRCSNTAYAWCKYLPVSRMPVPHRPQPPGFFSRGTCDLSGQINFSVIAKWIELYFVSWYVIAKRARGNEQLHAIIPYNNKIFQAAK